MLFSLTELMRRVKVAFDHKRAWGGSTPSKFMLAPRAFVWSCVRGVGELIDESSESPNMVYCGSHVWSGMSPHASQSGHTLISGQAKARWEQLMYGWVLDRGQDPYAIMGGPQFKDLWT